MKQSGVLGVGGDHITNDISMGLRIPMTRAEKLKIEEGSVTLGNSLPGDTILLHAGLYKSEGFTYHETLDGAELQAVLERHPFHLKVPPTTGLKPTAMARKL